MSSLLVDPNGHPAAFEGDVAHVLRFDTGSEPPNRLLGRANADDIGADLSRRRSRAARASIVSRRALTEHAPPGVGLGFVDLGDEDRAEIERFCRTRTPLYYDVDE